MQYYYVVSSLPSLYVDKKPEISIERFLNLCNEQLKEHDRLIIESVSIYREKATNSTLLSLSKWYEWETSLRYELAMLRAKNIGVEIRAPQSNILRSSHISKTAAAAFNEPSPLQAEAMLNKARWDYLDELEKGHYFDITKLVIYYIRLLILKRLSLFDAEKGKEIITHLICTQDYKLYTV
ncbi:hypothetical protein MCHI_001327 [Candidatus Magnetoovum chiemensis]|nr:hypothetical protein MCHI_001327 [Candidatus Magnetoovum chiemensis]